MIIFYFLLSFLGIYDNKKRKIINKNIFLCVKAKKKKKIEEMSRTYIGA